MVIHAVIPIDVIGMSWVSCLILRLHVNLVLIGRGKESPIHL